MSRCARGRSNVHRIAQLSFEEPNEIVDELKDRERMVLVEQATHATHTYRPLPHRCHRLSPAQTVCRLLPPLVSDRHPGVLCAPFRCLATSDAPVSASTDGMEYLHQVLLQPLLPDTRRSLHRFLNLTAPELCPFQNPWLRETDHLLDREQKPPFRCKPER